jgi:hypothetical protein
MSVRTSVLFVDHTGVMGGAQLSLLAGVDRVLPQVAS